MESFKIYNDNYYNTTFTMLFVIFLSIIAYYLKRKFSAYIKRRDKQKNLAEEYERKRKYRHDLAYHYYWQLDSGEREAARRTSLEILQLDEELAEMYDTYCELKRSGSVNVKFV